MFCLCDGRTKYLRQPRFCARHKLPGMMDVRNRRCEEPGCTRQPSYGMEGQRRQFCFTHKRAGDVDVKSTRCVSGVCACVCLDVLLVRLFAGDCGDTADRRHRIILTSERVVLPLRISGTLGRYHSLTVLVLVVMRKRDRCSVWRLRLFTFMVT